MPYSLINGANIYYEIHGNGPLTIMFIPGIGSDINMYEPQINYFKQMFQVLAIDLRGNGLSASLHQPINQIITTQCNDIVQLLEELNINTVVLVGVSYGGVIVQKFSAIYPEKVKALVITDSFCDTRARYLGIKYKLSSYLACPLYYLPRKLLKKLIKMSYKNWSLAADKMEKTIHNMRRWELVKQRLEVNKINLSTDLKKIESPTLIISGDQMPEHWASRIHHLIPNSKLEILKDSFDPSNLCQPEKFNEVLTSFIKKL